MLHPLESKLAAAWPPPDWADVTIVVAISGGCDSVALLRAMTALKISGPGRLRAAHLNHQLRANADADETFVVELCERLGVACEVGRAKVAEQAAAAGDGIEAAAREARYAFLEQTAARLGARFVATAHTADDQAETILHRIIRGTGVRGLAGMTRARPLGHATLIRPLLDIRRAELESYLHALGQSYRHDESNADLQFTRNRLRRETMPHLREKYNPAATDALLRLGRLAGEAQDVIDAVVAEHLDRCVAFDGTDSVRISLTDLSRQPRYLVRELLTAVWRRQNWPLQAMSLRKWNELAEMTAANHASRRVFPGQIAVEVSDGTMRLTLQR